MPSVAQLLAQEENLLGQLVEALKDEQKALTEGNTDELAPAVESKTRLIEALGRIGHLRNQQLASLGYGADRAGIASWQAKHSKDYSNDQMDRFFGTLGEAREMNRLNGELIALHLKKTRAALEILAPEAANNAPNTLYGARGVPKFGGTNLTGYRLIDSA